MCSTLRAQRADEARTVSVRFEGMRASHVADVAAMERRNYDFPWSAGIFRDCLRTGYHCRLMRQGRHLIGYGILQISTDEAHILNLCIDAPWQRLGHARRLLDHLIGLCTRSRATTVFLEVRPSNPRAIALYSRAGFHEIGTRRDYYDAAHGREDALVMARSIL